MALEDTDFHGDNSLQWDSQIAVCQEHTLPISIGSHSRGFNMPILYKF